MLKRKSSLISFDEELRPLSKLMISGNRGNADTSLLFLRFLKEDSPAKAAKSQHDDLSHVQIQIVMFDGSRVSLVVDAKQRASSLFSALRERCGLKHDLPALILFRGRPFSPDCKFENAINQIRHAEPLVFQLLPRNLDAYRQI